ncbi:YiiX/YebB-like N1pC/P60 family cysteine hydrolase [Streptococcus sp. A34]|uniref:YiiX/YebB-like N1pC/P60 family cysteine hydrolase n=1 Tax=unclassified Streptococcus TaxID=2608887 RepID=UPI00374CFDFE
MTLAISIFFASNKEEFKIKNKKLLTAFSVLCLSLALPVATINAEDSTDLYRDANTSVGNDVQLTPEQESILENMPNLEQEYLEYGLTAPVQADVKDRTRARIGTWSWRDGLICVTTQGFGTKSINTWHAAIVAPQDVHVVAEAPRKGENIRLKSGEWTSSSHTIWQVGVNATSVQQDWNAGHWAGQQVGKPYNINFWNARQTGSFYCSQLVWAAYYYTAGVDLNKSDNDAGAAIAIHPGEFVNNPKTTIVYRNR